MHLVEFSSGFDYQTQFPYKMNALPACRLRIRQTDAVLTLVNSGYNVSYRYNVLRSSKPQYTGRNEVMKNR